MSFRDDHTPVWEPVTANDTAAQNYYGLLVLTAGTVVFRSEASGSDMTTGSLAAGAVIPGRIVLVKSTGTSATLAGAKA